MQRLQNPPVKGFRGILLVLVLVLCVVADSYLVTLLTPAIGGQSAAILFWGLGVAIAGYVMWRYVLAYVYSYNGMLLRVSRAYGKRERLADDIYFRNILFAGTPADVRARYPNARVRRAVRAHNPIEPCAIAYRDGDKVCVYILQPEAALREKLIAAPKSK